MYLSNKPLTKTYTVYRMKGLNTCIVACNSYLRRVHETKLCVNSNCIEIRRVHVVGLSKTASVTASSRSTTFCLCGAPALSKCQAHPYLIWGSVSELAVIFSSGRAFVLIMS